MKKLYCQWGGAVLPIVLLLLWQQLSAEGIVNTVLLPPPEQVAEVFWQMLCSGELAKHLFTSFRRVIEGFLIAVLLACGIGFLMGLSGKAERFLNFTLQLIRPIPPIAWIPLAILWLGIEENSKVFIIVLGAFFPMFTNVLAGIKQTEKQYIELGRVLCLKRTDIICKIIYPSALPNIFTGCRIALGQAWMCVVAAELSAGMVGIGYLLTDARAMMQTDKVLVGMIAIGLVGQIMDALLRAVEKRYIHR